jgi:hypothetical protein
MPISFFTDKAHCPEEEEVSMILGNALPLWQQLNTFIAENYAMIGDLIYGGSKYGWNLWYRKSGNTLISLYPRPHEFTAQVILGREQVEKALQLNLGEYVGRVLAETPSLHDGRWLFLNIRNETDVVDVEQLLLIKKRPTKRAVKG